jgi:hypothetical protein
MFDLFCKKAIFYLSIDELPIYNWWKIHENGDMNQLVKGKGKVTNAKLAEVWAMLYDEFIDTFGVNEDFREYLELKRDIEILKIDMILDGDMSLQTMIEIKEFEMAKSFDKETKSNYNEVKVYVEKYMGFRLDEKTTSTKDYYTYLKTIEKEAKKSVKPQSNG